MTLQPTRTFGAIALLVLLASLWSTGCDSSEDPNLLNPPLPDSTQARVVNLLPNQVDVTVGTSSVATGLAPFQVSEYRRLLFPSRVSVIATSTGRDTLNEQLLPKASRLTYFIVGNNDSATIMPKSVGTTEEEDLRARGMARIVFINAASDSIPYLLRSGCQSGDTLVAETPFRGSTSVERSDLSLSLYLFGRNGSAPLATAHVVPTVGGVTYVIAARVGGRLGLYVLTPSSGSGPMSEAPAETRTTTSIELLNAFTDAVPASARISGGAAPIALDVPALDLSTAVDIDACLDPAGDSLLIGTGADPQTRAPIRLSVGTRTFLIAYGTSSQPRALALQRAEPGSAGGKLFVRAVNVSSIAGSASIELGAGAPNVEGSPRPFGTVEYGTASRYVEFTPGAYPILLRDRFGRFLSGSVATLGTGYYTMVIVDDIDSSVIMLTRDDQPGAGIDRIGARAASVLFFNMMPDLDADFTAGSITISKLPYSYTTSTVLPLSVGSISSNAGNASVDLTVGGYTVGATGSGSNHRVIAFPAPSAPPSGSNASVRFLNAVPDEGELSVRIDNDPTVRAVTTFGVPSGATELLERKYAFTITPTANPSDTVARIRGLELTAGRHYLLVVGPRKNVGTPRYDILWLQE